MDYTSSIEDFWKACTILAFQNSFGLSLAVFRDEDRQVISQGERSMGFLKPDPPKVEIAPPPPAPAPPSREDPAAQDTSANLEKAARIERRLRGRASTLLNVGGGAGLSEDGQTSRRVLLGY